MKIRRITMTETCVIARGRRGERRLGLALAIALPAACALGAALSCC